MKLYINKNFCGYRWFEIENIESSPELVALEQAKRNPNRSAIYGKLMIYDIYNFVFLTDGKDLILSIRGIEDSRRDSMGRQLNISAIFCEENSVKGFNSLHKILLAYLSDTKRFSEWFDGLFNPKVAELEFNVTSLREGLEKMQSCKIASKKGLGGLKYNSFPIYTIGSDYTVDTIVEQLGLPHKDVARANTTLEENKNNWLSESISESTNSDVDNPMLEEKSRLEEENKVLKQQITEMTIPTLPMSIELTKKVFIMYKRHFLATLALGFVIGLLIGLLV